MLFKYFNTAFGVFFGGVESTIEPFSGFLSLPWLTKEFLTGLLSESAGEKGLIWGSLRLALEKEAGPKSPEGAGAQGGLPESVLECAS